MLAEYGGLRYPEKDPQKQSSDEWQILSVSCGEPVRMITFVMQTGGRSY